MHSFWRLALVSLMLLGSSVRLTSVLAQSAEPFAGLSPGALAVARAVNAGNSATVAGLIPPSGAVQTSYPGDGSHVDRGTAVTAVTAAFVSNASASDAVGDGKYRLLAIWIPTAQPDQVFLVGSGIDSAGTRITTVFTVSKDGGSLLAYGRAGDTAGILGQFASSGDLRRIPLGTAFPAASPGVPAVGSGVKQGPSSLGHRAELAVFAFAVSVALASVTFARSRPS